MAWWGVIGFFKSGPVRVLITALMGVSTTGSVRTCRLLREFYG